MNTMMIALELRKNRLTLIGLALVFVIVPPLAVLVAPRAGLGVMAAIEAGLVLWTLAGLPLAAVFLGATAGAGLRAAGAREAESLLPGSAATRVARGLAGALLQFLILVLGTSIICAAVSPTWRGGVLGIGEGPQVWASVAPLRGLLIFLSIDLLMGSFLAAYTLSHALAGGLLGTILSAAQGLALGLGIEYSVMFGDRVESFAPLALFVAVVALAAKAFAVRPLARRFESEKPLGRGGVAGVALLLCAGLISSWAAEEGAYSRLRSSLRLFEPGLQGMPLIYWNSPEETISALNPAIRRAGDLATTVAGGLYWIAPDGRTVRLLADASVGRLTIFTAYETLIESAVWDSEGKLFVVRKALEPSGDKKQGFLGEPSHGLRPVIAARPGERVEGIVRKGGKVEFMMSIRSQPLSALFGAHRDEDLVVALNNSLTLQPRETPELAAQVQGDRRTLQRRDPGGRVRTWRLPGRFPKSGMDRDITPYLLAGKPAYFVPVQRDDDQGVAVCREDGRVDLVWKGDLGMLWPFGRLTLEVLPDDTLVHQYGYDWLVVDPAGTFLAPIPSKKLFDRWPRPAGAPLFTPRLVRRAGGHAWVIFEGRRLVEMEESSGAPLKSWPLPAGADKARVLEGGLLLPGTKSPFFIRWDGTVLAPRAATS